MACTCMFANLVVGDGTALKSENAQNVEKTTSMKETNDTCAVFGKSMKSPYRIFGFVVKNKRERSTN